MLKALAMTPYVTALAVAATNSVGDWQYKCAADLNISQLSYNLTGQQWFITGADGRLGYPVTSAALLNGASVVASSIDDATAKQNCERLKTDHGAAVAARATCVSMNLESFDNVRKTCADIKGPVDAVLHIAATMGTGNLTQDGLVDGVQVNTIAPALINSLLASQFQAAPHPRSVHVGSANCYDPLDLPATDSVEAAVNWTTGVAPHPGSSPYYWYSFSKYLLAHYAAELAKQVPSLTSFSVNPGFFRDDPEKYKDQCKPQLVWTPCPQYPMQGASSTFFTAAQPGIEAYSGSLIDFQTQVLQQSPYWIQSGLTCIPRPLPPPWTDAERKEWYEAVEKML